MSVLKKGGVSMLEKDINEMLKQAMKSGDKVKLSVLRMLLSEVKNKRIADLVKELDEKIIISLIQKMVRQRKESIEQFKNGNRMDLVQKEEEELKILESWLPEQLSIQELETIISDAVKSTGATSIKDMGKVMGATLDKVKGRMDGKVVSEMVRKKLG